VLWDSWNGERSLSSNKIERDDDDHFLLTEFCVVATMKSSGEMPLVDFIWRRALTDGYGNTGNSAARRLFQPHADLAAALGH